MALGDNWNDREMLEFAGLPIVMGNSVPELKTRGWRLLSQMTKTAWLKRFGNMLSTVALEHKRSYIQQ
jgi:phosphoserine phosphatase